jgi:hypothetical protein
MNTFSKQMLYTLALFILPVLSVTSIEQEAIALDSSFISPSTVYMHKKGPQYIKEVFQENERLIPLMALFDLARSNETLGFFGYHGSSSDFRIYQDLIRLGLEEILGISIKKDFHFLRIPGETPYNLRQVSDFTSIYSMIDDLDKNICAQLLSLQLSLYRGCAPDKGSCSIGFLADNYSISSIDYTNQIAHFFTLLGLDPEQARVVYEKAKGILPQENGILLQFFDLSHENSNGSLYEFLDRFAYASKAGGEPLEGQIPPSQYILESKMFPQLRLVIGNQHLLNPSSLVTIKRYDGIDPTIIENYEEVLRSFYRSQSVDEKQKEHYKCLLLSQWVS